MVDAGEDTNQLEWWRSYAEQLPLLAFLVRVVFSIPAASSKSERVFSVAGRIVTPARNRTLPEQVENLVIIKSNLRLLDEFRKKKQF